MAKPPPRPAAGRAEPAVVAQGLAVLAMYGVARRLIRPFKWLTRQLRGILFDWKDYNKYLREQSVVEGVFNGNKWWIGLGAIVWGVRALRKASSRTNRLVLNEVLLPGDQIFITQVPRKVSRKQRRAARRSA